ncbi:GNAT family N-acetyltransferase [Enterococcus rivorum]|uniref:N-acetyltransferase domain-containing protein n=1 Tax=Enterococcus rivorum TaxID=762845 RepID=A0A1E5KU27_9ENTE|nr:GNAT family N-acetyltransferase [Enterococcus rivorum]MBP2100620.1 ribosomal protein S18 acetylase RimI-like enzyme [Enterococcus rivorum]OEH81397.1 hypothetical protein BCR26_16575 [Enterococcus rivorum]
MKIREAKQEDIREIAILNQEELNYDYPIIDAEAQLLKILSSPNNQLFVAEIDDKIVGYVQASEYISTYFSPAVNIVGLAVSKKSQGKGVGRALMLQAENWAKTIDATFIRLSSGEERTEAHQFYQKIGYEKIKNHATFKKRLD